MSRLRVGAGQINPTVGDIDRNVALMLAEIAQATAAGVDVLVFPELAICGYPPQDLLLKPGFVADCATALAQVAAEATTCAVVVGSVTSADEALFNSAILCYDGRQVAQYDKRLLPNYAVFDEKRYFSVGTSWYDPIEINGVKVGLAICEDIWQSDGPVRTQAEAGAEVILVPNGSPYRVGKGADRAAVLQARSADHRVAIVYANQVGGQDELVFDGASCIFDSGGSLVARAPQFVEHLLVCDLEVSDSAVTVASGSDSLLIAESLDPLAEVWAALVLGTRDYAEKNGFAAVGVALSGGVDSSIVVAIAVDALGADRVHAVLMPSRYSSAHSVSDAVALCDGLGVSYQTIEIEPAHESLLGMLAPAFGERDADTTEENLQSRIRGVIMMALSNKLGWLILTTGNKSEIAVGYSTLYGDTAGGFAVIKDVYKSTVYELCRWRNTVSDAQVIPDHVITKAPSAELRPGQRDDQSLPPYGVLDAILSDYIERDLVASELIEIGHDPTTVRRIVRLVDIAEYKRRQNPPGVRVTSKAFGGDRRMPITNRYRG